MKTLEESIDTLMASYEENIPVRHTEYVEEWASPIYGAAIDEDTVEWTPCRQPEPLTFEDLEGALELTFHDSIKTFFGRWYAGDLVLDYQGHPITLLQIQSAEDGERLLANIAGHILMKRRLKQPETVFIGLGVENDDLLLSIDNQSGAVGLEWVGKEQHEVLADSLATWLGQCEPKISENSD
ncbi:SecY-interacting protein [Idiomarina aminovorans]|uniref:SecY-interacting protein n=1 Tax=Idiomarina aminovorans TaxID=2914829 RepID=UPI002005C860|nr:SecY-interacting protein [Idiomarina sp. ATCH4]MCK7460092.1 SecY-interacting protein [Idiomarina sp. ATCH4]